MVLKHKSALDVFLRCRAVDNLSFFVTSNGFVQIGAVFALLIFATFGNLGNRTFEGQYGLFHFAVNI